MAVGKPRGSEVKAEEWLRSVAQEVSYEGDGEGPPDFVIQHDGTEVAVEVTTVTDGEGWPPTHRIAFKHALQKVVEGVQSEPGKPRWHVWCEYDPMERKPPGPQGAWRQKVRSTLRRAGGGGVIQLVPEKKRVGCGVRVFYEPACNSGSFSGVSEDTGQYVGSAAMDRISACVTEKAGKVASGCRAEGFTSWWLVLLVDDVLPVQKVLKGQDWTPIKDGVRHAQGIDQWDKVVLISACTGEWAAVYERPGESTLGPDPRPD